MPIDIACPACQRKMRAPEGMAGKRVKCPGCQQAVVIPQTVGGGPLSRAVTTAPPAPPVERWWVLTAAQQRFGPIERRELDRWYAEGRLDAQCQVLREGGASWQWATELYPGLHAPPAKPAAPAPVDLFGDVNPASAAPEASPFEFGGGGAPRPPSPSQRYARRSEAVNWVAYSCYALVALVPLRIIVVGMATWQSFNDALEQRGAPASSDSLLLLVLFSMLFQFAIATVFLIPYGITGLAVQSRRFWGRVMCFVMAGFSCIFTLLLMPWLLMVFMAVVSFARQGDHYSDQNYLVCLLFDGLIFLGVLSHAILTFSILTRQRYGKEFR